MGRHTVCRPDRKNTDDQDGCQENVLKSEKEGKNQESMQSSTTRSTGH